MVSTSLISFGLGMTSTSKHIVAHCTGCIWRSSDRGCNSFLVWNFPSDSISPLWRNHSSLPQNLSPQWIWTFWGDFAWFSNPNTVSPLWPRIQQWQACLQQPRYTPPPQLPEPQTRPKVPIRPGRKIPWEFRNFLVEKWWFSLWKIVT